MQLVKKNNSYNLGIIQFFSLVGILGRESTGFFFFLRQRCNIILNESRKVQEVPLPNYKKNASHNR